MFCSISGHKIFLIICCIALLFAGSSVIILGLIIKSAIAYVGLDAIEALGRTTTATIVAGFFIDFTGATGICGSACEIPWLLCVHLAGLLTIVVMEFSIGVTVMVLRNKFEDLLDTVNCGLACSKKLRSVVLDMATPSAGLMLVIILVQAFMIYSCFKLYFYMRHRPKGMVLAPPPSVAIENVQMQDVGQEPYVSPQQSMGAPPPQKPLLMPSMPVLGHTPPPPMSMPGLTPPPPMPGFTSPPPMSMLGHTSSPMAGHTSPPMVGRTAPPMSAHTPPPPKPVRTPPPQYDQVELQGGLSNDMNATSTPISPSHLL